MERSFTLNPGDGWVLVLLSLKRAMPIAAVMSNMEGVWPSIRISTTFVTIPTVVILFGAVKVCGWLVARKCKDNVKWCQVSSKPSWKPWHAEPVWRAPHWPAGDPLICLCFEAWRRYVSWGSTLKSLDILVTPPKIGFEQAISGDFTFKKS